MAHLTAPSISVSVGRSRIISLISAALISIGAAHADAPLRVVSMNLCTDQLAMMLAAPDQLISISDIASDPRMSPMAEQAGDYLTNHGQAEEIYLLAPDLVLAGVYTDPVVISMLRRLGVRVEQIGLVNALDQVQPRIREVGALLGRLDIAEDVVAQYEADLARITPPSSGPRAEFYYPNGYALGTGTLSNDILTTAGFRHIAAEMGRGHSGRLALELMVIANPDVMIHAELYPAASRSEEIMTHPALQALPAAVTSSNSDWICGTPAVVSALSRLVALRLELEGS